VGALTRTNGLHNAGLAGLALCGGRVNPERHLMTGFGSPMGNRATGPLVD